MGFWSEFREGFDETLPKTGRFLGQALPVVLLVAVVCGLVYLSGC